MRSLSVLIGAQGLISVCNSATQVLVVLRLLEIEPALPALEPGAELPRCLRTVRGGQVIYDDLGHDDLG